MTFARATQLKLFLTALIIVACCAANRGSDHLEVLETKKLVLREKGGNARGVFEIGADGQPKLTFYGRDSTTELITLSLRDNEGPVIRVADKDGKPGLVIRTTIGPEVDFCNEKGIPQLSAGYFLGGYSALTFLDAKVATRISISSLVDGESLLEFKDNDGKGRVSVGVDRQGDTRFRAFDRTGASISAKAGGK
jgi:hypothetical protein